MRSAYVISKPYRWAAHFLMPLLETFSLLIGCGNAGKKNKPPHLQTYELHVEYKYDMQQLPRVRIL